MIQYDVTIDVVGYPIKRARIAQGKPLGIRGEPDKEEVCALLPYRVRKSFLRGGFWHAKHKRMLHGEDMRADLTTLKGKAIGTIWAREVIEEPRMFTYAQYTKRE